MVAKNAKQQTFNLIEPHVSKKKNLIEPQKPLFYWDQQVIKLKTTKAYKSRNLKIRGNE
jgi:hypothetical protein